MSLVAENISYRIKKKTILRDCSLNILPGRFTAVAGPNGAGKTTLLRIMSHEITKYSGSISLNTKSVTAMHHKELSEQRAVLPQHTTVNFPFTIEQVVEIGRYPHRSTRLENERIIDEVMLRTNVYHLKGRLYQSLSGGEQQRVQMARVMAQIWDQHELPRFLLLDEPTSSLDLAQQHSLLELIRELCLRNIGVLSIIHDLNLAAQYADDVLFLKDGRTIAYGTVNEIMTKEIIEDTFGHPVNVTYDERTDRPVIYPMPRIFENRSTTKQQTKTYAYELDY
jgi:iron complex transport system ATP-binding protein